MATDWDKELEDTMRRWREVKEDKSLHGMKKSRARNLILIDAYHKMYGDGPRMYWEYVKDSFAPLLRPLYPLMLLLAIALFIKGIVGFVS